MSVFCWKHGFRIKTKADAEEFVNMLKKCDSFTMYCEGDLYDYSFSESGFGFRHTSERGNVFSPYIIVSNDKIPFVEYVWSYRKHINNWFKEKEK